MTATNHALTGAIIGLAVHNPWLAIPAAFVSHFILDATPHFDPRGDERKNYQSRWFHVMLGLEVVLCGALVFSLAIVHPAFWLLAAICAFVAASPDLMWVSKFVAANTDKPFPKYKNPLVILHNDEQKRAHPSGVYLEIAWFIFTLTVLLSLVKL